MILGEVVSIFRPALLGGWFLEMGWMYILAIILIIAMGVMLLKFDANDQAEQAEVQAEEQADTQPNAPNDGILPDITDVSEDPTADLTEHNNSENE